MSENPTRSLSYEHKSRKELIQEISELRTMLKVERESRETGISEVLRESEQKYHTVFEQAAIGPT
jgi:DNA-binding protein H-NS